MSQRVADAVYRSSVSACISHPRVIPGARERTSRNCLPRRISALRSRRGGELTGGGGLIYASIERARVVKQRCIGNARATCSHPSAMRFSRAIACHALRDLRGNLPSVLEEMSLLVKREYASSLVSRLL